MADLATPCKIWTGSRFRSGYGERVVGGKHKRVHRLAWIEAFGPIPEGMCVCHHCDTPACYEPTHLFLGTQKENVADAVAKGRMNHPCGASHPMAKLTAEQVIQIRATVRLNPVGVTGGEVPAAAREYGVAESTICRILNGKAWQLLGVDSHRG